jgi:hypothetical protein
MSLNRFTHLFVGFSDCFSGSLVYIFVQKNEARGKDLTFDALEMDMAWIVLVLAQPQFSETPRLDMALQID